MSETKAHPPILAEEIAEWTRDAERDNGWIPGKVYGAEGTYKTRCARLLTERQALVERIEELEQQLRDQANQAEIYRRAFDSAMPEALKSEAQLAAVRDAARELLTEIELRDWDDADPEWLAAVSNLDAALKPGTPGRTDG
jgi:hypothetical protein